jgi:hypothetical protein
MKITTEHKDKREGDVKKEIIMRMEGEESAGKSNLRHLRSLISLLILPTKASKLVIPSVDHTAIAMGRQLQEWKHQQA